MHGLRAVAAADIPQALGAAWWRRVGATQLAPRIASLRGLTINRVGLVLLLCVVLSARQMSACMSLDSAACINDVLGGQMIYGNALLIARRFLGALPMLVLISIADNVTARSGTGARVGMFCGAVLLGALSFAFVFSFTHPSKRMLSMGDVNMAVLVLMQFFQALLPGALGAAVLFYFSRERRHARDLHDSRLAKMALDRQVIEARLQVLQAQIEPHFLFNTLANIRELYEIDGRRAKSLIHDFAEYLRAAIPLIRGTGSTVGQELALAQAYLGILKIRMGDRLSVSIDVPLDLRNARLPPMMLSTLVENAIKHGLSPRPAGGTVAVCVDRHHGALRVVVSDDGVGFQKKVGSGVGLANTRARLAGLYGNAGRLTLDANAIGGVSATIELPYATAETSEAA